MNILINKQKLLEPLLAISGVVERRQSLPILSNILLQVEKETLKLTATDMEVESCFVIPHVSQDIGKTTIPARKFLDIIKALPDEANVELIIEEEKIKIHSGKSKFTLSTMPADDFPAIENLDQKSTLNLPETTIKKLLDSTQFAMAHQDVRYYLNGLLIELDGDNIRAVATDGHRLALSETRFSTGLSELLQIIVPRKGVLEINRLLDDGEKDVEIVISSNHLRVVTENQSLTTKLIDGKFPDYDRVIPQGSNKKVVADREKLRSGMARTSILSNEKFRGIRMVLEEGKIISSANNPEQETAEEEIEVIYSGDGMEIGFNVSYLLDVLNIIKSDQVFLELKDSDSSCLITSSEDSDSRYVIMPMRL
ncbi:MAG: DNA polymerase III subunit beta [Gammaproteobacteria bacterium]